MLGTQLCIVLMFMDCGTLPGNLVFIRMQVTKVTKATLTEPLARQNFIPVSYKQSRAERVGSGTCMPRCCKGHWEMWSLDGQPHGQVKRRGSVTNRKKEHGF